MTLSERLAIPQIERAERRRFLPDSSGPASSQHLERLPEWRRRMLERLEKNGRVAEKALDR